jgi:hypothetical protein
VVPIKKKTGGMCERSGGRIPAIAMRLQHSRTFVSDKRFCERTASSALCLKNVYNRDLTTNDLT